MAETVESVLNSMHLTLEQLKDVQGRMHDNMMKGLGKASNPVAAVKMYPTYVRSTPDGTEKGDFLALDLGGSNFRVLYIKIEGAGKVQQQSEIYKLTKELMEGTGQHLFDYIAECLANFVKDRNLTGQKLPLGFTFSFPCKQQGLASATLTTWTKGFTASGVVGQDVCQLLYQAVGRRGDVDLDVIAVVNDTTGTLMSCAHDNPDCMVGLILGTGTNACYVEQLENVELWDSDTNDPKQVLINMEWGAFGDDGTLNDIRTEYDETMDQNSFNVGKQKYEKMISGMYLGELVRIILLKLADSNLAFGGKTSDLLKTQWKFETAYLSQIEGDESADLSVCAQILKDLGLTASSQDCVTVKTVCEAVSGRAAKLASAGIAAVACQLKQAEVTVGVDGSLYKKHPKFHDRMTAAIKQLAPTVKVKFMLSEDGSGKGAALVAAVAVRMAKVESILKPFQLTVEDFVEIKHVIYNDLVKGLGKETNPTGNLKMNPTHVRAVPDGTEKGKFLALDLGGSNFRVLCYTLEPGQPVQKNSKNYKLTKELLSGTGEQLFDYIAECLAEFLEQNGIRDDRLPLGFTFSYPCTHITLEKAILQVWTKDFNVSGVIGKDVGELLCQALKKRGVSLDLMAIINDTTGVLVSCAYDHQDCKIGLIVGTGCNCCYMEKLDNVELWNGDMDDPKEVAIDIEWGALGDDGSLDTWRTPIDFETDAHTVNSGHQKYEKMITGNYIGEIVRLIVSKLAQNGLLFGGKPSKTLTTKWTFDTKYISEIEREPKNTYDVCKKVLRDYGVEASLEDCQIVRRVCEVASTRAAWLATAGIAAVAAKIGVSEVTVGIDGSMYINHPKFHDHMTEAIKVLSNINVKFVRAEDGSGRGGALVAAAAAKVVA
ncbi:hexokinase-2-like [Glandiceps talaboti]